MSLRSTPELAKEYPFVLMTGSISLVHYHGLGLQNPAFRKRHPDPLLEMSPQAAVNLGLHAGDPVDIEVPGKKDKVRRKVGIFEGLNDNVVCAEGHWYLPEEEDREKRLWAANVNVLTTLGDGYDPVVGGSTCRTLLCRITKPDIGLPLTKAPRTGEY